MLKAFRARSALRRKAGEIYGAIVTQARQPEFYAKLGIPDTPAGRYDTVVLHLFLVLERLRRGGEDEALQRALIEAFVADMDDSLRELGTGDVVVGKKVRRAAAGFYERVRDYREALAAEDTSMLERALIRHGLGGTQEGTGLLAAYVRATAAALEGQAEREMMDGRFAFPPVPGAAEDDR